LETYRSNCRPFWAASAEKGFVVRPGDQVAEIELQRFHLQLAGFDLGQVEHVVEDAQQAFAGLADDFQPFDLFRGQGVAGHGLGHAEDAVEGRADFMAHGGQEGGLGGAGGVGLADRLIQFGLGLEAFRNVADDGGVDHAAARRGLGQTHLDRGQSTVLGQAGDVLAIAHAAAENGAGGEGVNALLVCLAPIVRNEQVDRLAQDLGRGIAEDDLGALAEQQDPHVLVGDDDPFGRDVQNAAEDVLQHFRQARLNRQRLLESVPGMTPA